MSGLVSTEIPPEAPRSDEIALAAPPSVERARGRPRLSRLFPIIMSIGMLGVTMMVFRSGALTSRNPAFAVLPLLMLTSSVGAVLAGRSRHRTSDLDGDRDEYLSYLSGLRDLLAERAAALRTFALWMHPEPAALWLLAGGPRMWQRRPGETEFGCARVGIGSAAPATRLTAPATTPLRVTDPVTDSALRRFLDAHIAVPEVPVALDLLGQDLLVLDGDGSRVRGLLRAVVCQLVTTHGPDALLIAVIDRGNRGDWEWLNWLPHHQHPAAGAGTGLLIYPDLRAAEADLIGRRAVVIVDDADGLRVTQNGARGVARRLRVTAAALSGSQGYLARPDFMTLTDAMVCARRLAGYGHSGRTDMRQEWAQLLGIGEIDQFDPAHQWAHTPAHRLRVPIGVDANGDPILLDIAEAAKGGSGPHGLCIGATGSGKSEFLRTLVLGMTVRHSPVELNLVLVDFKGGATFLGFDNLDHVAAIITNLNDEAPLVERMGDALSGELHRRQELLRTAGVADISCYGQARRTEKSPLPALPTLLVIVDEFSELLHQHPDFLDTFVAIGRLGRSLGVHLLLASQRLEEGRLRGLDAHLSYRVCFKTMSAAESRMVLGTNEAHELANLPGLGYLRTADGAVRRFQAAYVSGPCPSRVPATDAVRPFTAAPRRFVEQPDGPPARTVAQAILQRLHGHGPPARRIWLPPLRDSPDLGSLLDGAADLAVPIGVVDRPFEQRRTTLVARLCGSTGHVAVVGSPRSGKSTTLHTLIAALSATHDPERVTFYCMDFGGGELSALAALPQVGTVAGRGQTELIRRMVAEVETLLSHRESGLSAPGEDGDPVPEIFLVIDGWAAVCSEVDRDFDLASAVVAVAARGLAYGVHVMLAASRWADVRPALRDLIGTRIELRLGDPAESEVDGRRARQVPKDQPGRGLTEDGMHMLVALPRGWTPLHHSDVVAAPIRILPSVIDRADLLARATGGDPVLGIDERGLDIVTLDFDRQPHLVVLGDNECGKTAALRTVCRELVRTRTAAQAQLLVVDYRRNLLGVVPAEHLAGYAMSEPACTALLPGLVERLAARMPGAELSPQQLRDRSWWSGPQLYVMVDDYDLVAAGNTNPLAPLLSYLPYAADVGLHLVVARRSGGMARSLYEPIMAALVDLGAMRLEMSQDNTESALRPGRPRALPPGRGTLVTRAQGERLIQVAWEP